MSWIAPPPPCLSQQSRIEYWRQILDIPDDEPGAVMLRAMAAERLVTFHELSEEQARQYTRAPESPISA